MIEVVNVTKKFGDFTAIQDLNFKVSDGSIYGLIGYNGAGKTTLLKTITGVYKPDGGEVRLDGENAFDNAKMKQHMFYVPDDIYFAPYANMEKMAKNGAKVLHDRCVVLAKKYGVKIIVKNTFNDEIGTIVGK